MVEDTENVLRIVWHSRDFGKEGKLKGSAFSASDLVVVQGAKTTDRYVSMDRYQGLSKDSVDWRIAKATMDGTGAKERRIAPKFAEFNSGELRAARDEVGTTMFEVTPFPLLKDEDGLGSPPNPAHVGICSKSTVPLSEDERKLRVEQLRTKLLDCRRRTIDYADLFGGGAAA